MRHEPHPKMKNFVVRTSNPNSEAGNMLKTEYGKDAAYWLKKKFLSEMFRAKLDEIPVDAVVLDLGCGGGRAALYLAMRGCNVWGLDADATMIESLTQQHPEVSWMCGDAEAPSTWESLPTFDWIISNVCIRKDQCRLEKLAPFLGSSNLELRIQSAGDLNGYLCDNPCYSTQDITRIFPDVTIEVEKYSQRFSSADYLAKSIQQIGLVPNGKYSANVPREYLNVSVKDARPCQKA